MNVVSQVLRRFRWDILALVVVAIVMARVVKAFPVQPLSAIVPLMGIVVSIFIGFRNRNAYNRWWEARTLWTTVVVNGRSLHYALMAYEDGSPEMAAITDRMRRREVHHARRLAAELHGTAAASAGDTAAALMSRQAADIGELTRAGMIDRQARRVLVTINAAQSAAAVGLERIRHQPIPRFYDLFIRGLAWFFAIVVCTRIDGGHNNAVGIVVGFVIMALVILAEQLGRLLDEPMSDDIFGLPLDRYCAQLTAELSPGLTDEGTVSANPLKGRP